MRWIQIVFVVLLLLTPAVTRADCANEKIEDFLHDLHVSVARLLDLTSRLHQLHDTTLSHHPEQKDLDNLTLIVSAAYFSSQHILDLVQAHHYIVELSQSQEIKDAISKKIIISCDLYRHFCYNLISQLQTSKKLYPKKYSHIIDESLEAIYDYSELMQKGYLYDKNSHAR